MQQHSATLGRDKSRTMRAASNLPYDINADVDSDISYTSNN